MFWGYSPALDLNKELEHLCEKQVINILLVGTSDARHIIKTLSQSYKYDNIQYNFYVTEKLMEQVARQVILLNIILEPECELGLFEKVRIFMELFGNTVIRPPVSKYLYKKSTQLIEAITNFDYAQRIMPIFNFEKLKFRERDYLENIFKFWQKPDSEFDILKAWDARIRKALGTRYDNRKGVFDWDYHMRLCDIGGKIIFSREYINWRENGIAFTWIETDGSKPNLTLAAGILANGLKLHHFGYVGDITVSPFIAYGIECDDEKMFEKQNFEYKKRSTDVTERNLVHMVHEICYRKPFSEDSLTISSNLRSAYMEFSNLKTNLYNDYQPRKYDPKNASPLLDTPNVTVTFLSNQNLSSLHNKNEYIEHFDLFVFSNQHLDDLDSNLLKTAKNGALILIETKKFFVSLNKDEIKNFGETIKTKASNCNLETLFEFDPIQDAYARFKLKHNDKEIKSK